MANYQSLKAAINAVIKANGNKEITGTVLNEVLLAMVNSLGAGYQFAGVATPSTNPGTPDQNVFYIAGQAGTYTNFNSIALPDGVSILKWNGSWSGETVVAVDGAFDISAYKATGGTLATFADLSAALDGGNNVPQSLRKGGMSVKFVQSSDNKYVQYRLMANTFSTTVADWQGVDDEPTAESDNLVKSGGVSYVLANIDIKNTANYNNHAYYSNDGSIRVDSRCRCTKVDISKYYKIFVRANNTIGACVLTNELGTVLAYWNYDGTKIETINLSQYTQPKWFLYTNFAPHLPEEDMLLQLSLKEGLTSYIAKHEQMLSNIDNTPTDNSSNLVESGGVKSYVDNLQKNISGELDKTIAESIKMTTGYVIYTANVAIGETVDLTPHILSGGEYAILPCTAGDDFIFNGTAYGVAKVFAFVDSSNKLLMVDSLSERTYHKRKAPTNAAKVIINNYNNPSAVSYRGKYLFAKEINAILGTIENSVNTNSQEISNLQKAHNYGVDIHDFTNFVSIGSSWTITSDNKSATSNGNGYANRLSFDKDSFEDASILSAKITPSSSTFNVLIGKTFANIDGVSTLLGVLKDSNHTYLTVNTIINSSEVSMKHKFDISSLNIGYGLTFYVKLEKSVQNTMLYNVSITDDIGNCFEVDGLGNGDTLSDDLLSLGNGEIDGANWGRITLFCESGGAVFSDISFGYPLLMSDLALTIVGHSMVEANTMNDEKNKRFAALLRDSIGEDRVCINGQGGMNTGSEGLLGWIDNLLEYVKSSKYVLFCLGTNDGDSQNTCTRFTLINDKVKAKGMRPIWMTVIPKRDGTTFPIVNAYIKNTFEYIDIERVFYNADGTIDTSKFVDTVHPNTKGYQAMYNAIKNDKTYLWTV